MIIFAIILFCLSFPEKASALVVKKDLGTLAAEADLILTGKVTNMKSQWEGKKIFTYVTVEAKDFLKGAKKTEITIKVPGGTVGETACRVSHSPSFKKGEEVFLFLRTKDGCFEVAGAHQGKYTVKDKQVLGTKLSVREFSSYITGKVFSKQEIEKGETKPAVREKANKLFQPPSKNKKPVLLERGVNQPTDSSNKTDYNLSGGGGGSSSSWVNVLYEGFPDNWPSGDPKWERGGSPPCYYTWGEDDYKPYKGSFSAWCADIGIEGCNDLDPEYDNYPDNMDAWMVYGPFDLSDATSAHMTFYHWTKTEAGFYDGFFYGASSDGKNFDGLELTGDLTPWRQETISLDEYCGDSSVWVGFNFYSDAAVTYKGTFVDELIIEKYLGPPPEITGVVPTFGPAKAKDLLTYEAASDSTLITINGKNFGSSPGEVAFFAGQGNAPFTFATIKSWSENQITCLVPGGASSYYKVDNVGNVFVITGDEIISDPALFRVTYSYGGGKWPGNKVTYKVNPNTADCTGEEIAVQKGLDAWNNTGANFKFEYGGATDKTRAGRDSENSIAWVNEGETDWLAVNWIYWDSSDPKTILESDIEFSDYYFWSTAAACPSEQLDIQGVITHELGHSLMLLDLYGTADSEKTMYGFVGPGETKARTLEQDDIEGIKYIYGTTNETSTIVGVVYLEKVNPADPEPDSPLADHSGTEIKLIPQGNLNPVKSGLSSRDGSYSISGLAPGTYEVHYCRPGFSKVERKNIILEANQSKDLPVITLYIGDMNQDTQINILDLLWMTPGIGLSPENPEWPGYQVADVNKDGTINILDLLRVAKNIGKRP
ncbi:MAG TPA: hypothetical protein DCK87_03000 [Desulfotomaculum sp.]|nr:hypothetical protein [Desulfotomaculum sp.]